MPLGGYYEGAGYEAEADPELEGPLSSAEVVGHDRDDSGRQQREEQSTHPWWRSLRLGFGWGLTTYAFGA